MSDAFLLEIEGGPAWVVRSFELFEQSHVAAHARIQVHLAAGKERELVAEELIGKKARLELAPAGLSRDAARSFFGVVEEVQVRSGAAELRIVPRLMTLADGCDHRIFLDTDTVSISRQLLEEAGLTVDVRVGEAPKPRVQCVQAFESTLDFVRRILAEDGISLWLEHHDEDVVVLGDSVSSCTDLPGTKTLPFLPRGGLEGAEAITFAEIEHRLTHDGVTVNDYDPEKPAVDQLASAGSPNKFPRFVFPAHHRSPEEGKQRAQVLLEAAQTNGVVLRARTTCRYVAVGFLFEITDAPREDLNGTFRILEVRHRGKDFADAASRTAASSDDEALRYQAELLAVPEARPVRPAIPGPKSLGGLQTMTITGPAGKEVAPDDQGRVKAHFRWDRLRPFDDTSSAWIRPMQPALSGGFMLPRTQWEVLVGFLNEPDGDTPIELGRLINGEAPPAESLPGQKVRSNWGTPSTPGAAKQNQLRFDDAAGNEGMLTFAGTDLNERTENDKITTVTANESISVGGNHTNTVTLQQVTGVLGAQTYSVGGNRDLTTVGALGLTSGAETVVVGGTRKFKVGGDYETKTSTLARIVGAAENVIAVQETNRHVTGASTIAVGGTWTEIGGAVAATGVLGASTLTVTGPISVQASKVSLNATTLTEKYAGLFKGHAGGKLTAKSPKVTLKAGAALKLKGADVFFRASSKITVKAGGVTITITPSSIKVKGKLKGDAASVVTTKEEVT